MSREAISGPGRLPVICGLALACIFLFSGTVGHDPWKQDETYSFGIIYHFYQTKTWLVPVNAGTPFLEKPPLYYWTAVACMHLLNGWMPLHDAARMATLLYVLLALCGLAGSARLLFHDRPRQVNLTLITLLLFLASPGIIRHSHDMFTDTALLAGASIGLWGLAGVLCLPQKWVRGGMLLGVGMGMAFLCKGFLTPLIFALAVVLLIAFYTPIRNMQAVKALIVAVLVASPIVMMWPMLLYQSSHDLFRSWFWDNNVGRFLGFSVGKLGADNKPGYMLYTAVWFAFPSFLLAAVTLWRSRREWRRPEYALPTAILVPGMFLMLTAASARALYLLPLMPAVAILAVDAYGKLSPAALTWANRIFAALAGAVVWLTAIIWWCLSHPSGTQVFGAFYGKWLPVGFMPDHSQNLGVALATVAVMLWLCSLKLSCRSHARAAYRWFASAAIVWIVPNCLLMPWIDQMRSFRPPLKQLVGFLKNPEYHDQCISRYHLGENEAPMWEYFGEGRGIGPYNDFANAVCPLLLDVSTTRLPPENQPGWQLIWRGSRIMEEKDEFRLYRRQTN